MRCLLLALAPLLLLSWSAGAVATEVTAAGLVEHRLATTAGYVPCASTMALAVQVDFATGSAVLRGADAVAPGADALGCLWPGDQFLAGRCAWSPDTTVTCAQSFQFPGDGTSSWSTLRLAPDGASAYAYHYGNPNPGHPSYTVTLAGVLARA